MHSVLSYQHRFPVVYLIWWAMRRPLLMDIQRRSALFVCTHNQKKDITKTILTYKNQIIMECPNCKKFVEENWKFCPHCHITLTPSKMSKEEQNNPLQIYKNKAIWNIVQGEVARRIRESELNNFDQITGIIIEEGVSAYIYVDGNRVAELNSGTYEFTAKEDIEQVLNEHAGGIKINISNAWKWVVGLVKGRRISDQIKSNEDITTINSLENVLHYLRQDSVVSIYLKLDKTFPLVCDINDDNSHKPIEVRTKLNDIQVGLTMQVKIDNFNDFIPYYLVEKKNINRQDIQHELQSEVHAVLRHILDSEIIDETGLSAELKARIEKELIDLSTWLHGVAIVRIVEISCNSTDFDHFRALAKEIYISEREMDYMRRTQEMKNRLVSFENSQTIHSVRSRYELEKALNEINKDGLLERDELYKFVKSLDAQRQIFDAKSDFEVKRALNEIRRNELLSDEEVEKLASDIISGRINRHHINEILAIEASNREKQAKLDAELVLQQKQNDFARANAISNAQTEDAIERIRIERDRELANDSLNRLQQLRQIQLDADERELRMKREDYIERTHISYRHEEDMLSLTHKHEENIHAMDTNVEIHRTNSKEREALLLAEKEHEARERELAMLRELNEERKGMYQNMQADMKEITMASLAATNSRGSAVKTSIASEKTSTQEENSTPEKRREVAYYIPSIYGNAISFNLDTLRAMITAGNVKSDTIIRVDGQDWPACTMKELSDLFVK